jgi:DNA polymerase III epsilon subunit-like protein
MELFFDTETSGFLSKKIPFDHKDQGWVVQLAAVLSTNKEIIKTLNVLIIAGNRTINSHAQAVHKISVEQANKEGIPEAEAIAKFADLQLERPTKICHNYSFDSAFVYQMFQRNLDSLNDQQRSIFYIDLPHFCTMKDKRIKTFADTYNKRGQLKWPKLSELYKKLFKKDFPDAHDALADVMALRECYYKLQEKEII